MRGGVRLLAIWLLLAVTFGLTYTQAPLYYSNQNQYFLHGLAQGGMGELDADWLANTRDPTPFFSPLVAATYRWLPEATFYVYYALVLGAYCGALTWIYLLLASGGRKPPEGEVTPGDSLALRGLTPPARLNASLLLFLVLLFLIHSGIARWASGQLTGVDYPWYFQAGIAGQYILGPTFQPSTFGVLLVLSIALFLADRPWLAVVASSAGSVLHATYLLPAAMLTLAYAYVLLREGRRREAVLVPLLSLALVLPAVVMHVVNFAPTSAESFAEAQRLLARFRIPHHCDVRAFFDWVAGLQLAWVGLAIGLTRGSRLMPVLLIVSLLSAALSALQIATGSDGLALLFPWRASSMLVPVATAVVLTRVVGLVTPWLDRLTRRAPMPVLGTLAGLLVLLAGSGVIINVYDLGYQGSNDELAMLEWVKKNLQPGDLYQVPVELPKPATKPGAFFSDFRPLAQRKSSAGLIPLELQRFRLFTGAPIVIDFKSIPYQDVEVLEWYERVQANLRFYDALSKGADPGTDLLTRHRVTHVVTRAQQTLQVPGATLVHEDPNYRVYRLEPRRPSE